MKLQSFLRWVAGILAVGLMIPLAVSAEEMPYNAYTYNAWDKSVPSPAGYEPAGVYTGEDLGAGMLRSPSDLYVDAEGLVYLSDTGNNRVLVLNKDLTLLRTVDTVEQEGEQRALQSPAGLFVDNQGWLYICETEGGRVIAVDGGNRVRASFERPDSELIADTLNFAPSKVLVNRMGTVYVIVDGFYMGAVTYNKDGSFKGFFGSNRVEATLEVLISSFWKSLFSQEQKDKMARYVPIQYTNFDLDTEGFIYTCTQTTKTSLDEIKKLNSQGTNVLPVSERNTGIKGDYGDLEKGWLNAKKVDSQLVDICVDERGFIYALDYTRGRIFQYDQESRLLQVFGSSGDQEGTFKTPVAIDSVGGKLLVLDSGKCQITVFDPTAFGSLVEEAVLLYNDGRYGEAKNLWAQVLDKNVNYEIAYDGIGKALFEEGDYTEAMVSFRHAYNRKNYSDAFKEYRSDFIRNAFPWIFGGLAVLAAGIWILVKIRRRRPLPAAAAERSVRPGLRTARGILRLLFHGTEEYEELKYHRRFSPKASLLILLAWFAAAIAERQLTGFIFNRNNLDELNILSLFASTVLMFTLVVIGNWSVSTLLDGKGRFGEIWISLSYALIPFITTTALGVLMSNALVAEERVFLLILQVIGILWSFYLVMSAMMSVHQYSFGKAVICLLLTAAAVAFMLFLFVLLFGLVQQFISFFRTIYNEIMFRR